MNNQLLQKTSFQDLMLNRIHEILLVASPYDAFILEEEGGLTQQILYEYLGMNLSYAPRVWHAESATKGLKMLSDRAYDMVIVMMRKQRSTQGQKKFTMMDLIMIATE